MATKNSVSNEDRISELAEPLIHHILSFLDTESSVQTSVLSRRWRYIWTSLPTLNFNSNIFFRKSGRDMDSFVDFVNMVLIVQHRNSDLQRFCINLCDDQRWDEIRTQLNAWVLCALRRNVRELYVDINVQMKFNPLPCVFNSKSLTKLELVMGGSDRRRIVLPKSMDLPRLKSLKLVYILLHNVNRINKLFSSCPVLESLILAASDLVTDNQYLTNINISSVTLKHFELINCRYICNSRYVMANCIRLQTPNLTSFVCKDYISQDYSLENLSSLVTADIDMSIKTQLSSEDKEVYANRMTKFLRVLHNVKQLILSPGLLEVVSAVPDLIESHTPQFSNLRYLTLDMRLSTGCLRATTYLLKICPNIESLFLGIANQSYSENIGDDWEAEPSIPCFLHHLKVIEVRGVKGCLNEFKILEFLLKKAMVLERMLVFSRNGNFSSKVKNLSIKLGTLPRASSCNMINVL